MELFVKGCAAVRDRMSLMVMVTVIVMMMMVMVMVVMMMLMRTMMMRDEPGITGWNHLTGTTLMRICLMISVSCRRWLRRPARVIPAHYAGPQKPTLAFLVLHLPSSSEVHRSVSLSNRPRFVLAEYTLWWNRFPPVSHFCFFFLCFLFEKSRKRLAGCWVNCGISVHEIWPLEGSAWVIVVRVPCNPIWPDWTELLVGSRSFSFFSF